MSTKRRKIMFLESRARSVVKADNLTASCEPTVYTSHGLLRGQLYFLLSLFASRTSRLDVRKLRHTPLFVGLAMNTCIDQVRSCEVHWCNRHATKSAVAPILLSSLCCFSASSPLLRPIVLFSTLPACS
jgi:hypothetical protein